LTSKPDKTKFKIDTQITNEDLKENMILIGGPIINIVSGKINEHLPIRFTKKGIYSSCSKKTYSYDESGMIAKIKNPFNKEKSILIIAGNTNLGTKACIAALYDRFEEVGSGNRNKPRISAKVVEGIDTNGDENIGAAKILE
jgi:S-layer protein (TIGR01564 family)